MDDILFLIDQQSQAIHALEPLAAGIWSLLSEPMSIAEIKAVVKQAFPDMPPKRIASDIKVIIDDFQAFDLVAKVR